jgi:hypothetical protein
MRNSLLVVIVLFSLQLQAQVVNEVSVFVKPGTEVHLFENVTNSATGNFEVGDEGLLYVDGTLTNNGSMTFNNASSLMRGATGNDGTGSGTYFVKRQGSSSSAVYNYWSSPMQTYSGVPGSQAYLYNPNNGTIDFSDDQPADPGWTAHSGAMTPGAGYAGRGAGLATFNGDVNNGNVTYPLTYYPYIPGNPAAGTPFNLVGNPYPSAVSCASLVAGNADINGSLYFWDDDISGGAGYNSSDYAIWNGTGSLGTGSGSAGAPNGTISTGQGFKVRALTGSANLNFNNTMRVANTTQFFKPNADDSRMWFSIEGNNLFNQILLGVLFDATDEEDRLYDAIKFHGNSSISLAAQNQDREYSILAFPPPASEKSIPLSVFVDQAGAYTFTANVMENFEYQNVFFVDTKRADYIELQEGTEITVQLEEGAYNERFYLNFYPDGFVGIPESTSNQIDVYANRDLVYLNSFASQQENLTLRILDINGRLVLADDNLNLNGKKSYSLAGVATGFYMVSLTNHAIQINEKVLISH